MDRVIEQSNIPRRKSFEYYDYQTPLETIPPQWSTNRTGHQWEVGGYSHPILPAGVYIPQVDYYGNFWLDRVQFSTDDLLDLPDDPSTKVIDHIKDFWSKREAFAALNFTFKRGIILYGPPGSGKSTTIFRLEKILEANDVIMIISSSPHKATKAIKAIKSLEPERKIIVVFEDIDGIIHNYGDESLTQLLDGGVDVNNVLFIATTNYPERIPPRVINRPSRFDVVIKIDFPSDADREFYINHIVGDNILVDIKELVRETAGFTLAMIKEVIILTQIFGYSVKEAVDKLNNNSIVDSNVS